VVTVCGYEHVITNFVSLQVVKLVYLPVCDCWHFTETRARARVCVCVFVRVCILIWQWSSYLPTTGIEWQSCYHSQ